MYSMGLGDDTVDTTGGYVAAAPATFLNALGQSINTSVANIDWTSLDWHEWALIAIGAYVVIRGIKRSVTGAGRAVGKRVKKTTSGFHKRRRALKTVFTG